MLYLFYVDLRGFDGTKVNCFDDAVEAQYVAAGVDQHEHSLYKHEHSLEPARAYTGQWLMCALKLMHLTRKGSRYC